MAQQRDLDVETVVGDRSATALDSPRYPILHGIDMQVQLLGSRLVARAGAEKRKPRVRSESAGD